MRTKLDATTHEAATLQRKLREKTVECEALQAAAYDAQSALADLKSAVCMPARCVCVGVHGGLVLGGL